MFDRIESEDLDQFKGREREREREVNSIAERATLAYYGVHMDIKETVEH